jgi:hypothetical protein
MAGKIVRAAEKFDLEDRLSRDLDAALVRRWNGIGHEEMGVRSISNWFNQKLMQVAYDEAGLSTLDSRIQSDYEALTEGDGMVKDSVMIELEGEGVDPEELIDHFVSGPTIYRYLTDNIGAEKEKEEEDKEWEADAIDYQIDKLNTTIEEALSSLESKGKLDIEGDFDSDVRVYVEDGCGRTSLSKALNQGYISKSDDSTNVEDSDQHDNGMSDESRSESRQAKLS